MGVGGCVDLTGQVGVISGGLGDIGRAIALALAACGADVAVGDVLAGSEATSLLRQIVALQRRARYDRVDVADAAAVAAWIEAVERDLGDITLVVPNAAVVQEAGVREVSDTEWRSQLSANLDGAFHLARCGSLRMLRHGRGGRIVFIGSWAGRVPHPGILAYCVSKAGVSMLCRCMAADLARDGILVNEVAPGYVDAGLSGRLFKEDPGRREEARQSVPVGELISPEEVARQVVWLCDPLNRQVVGQTLTMDGGLSLFGPGGQRR
ncbi:MAG: SDR family oxidoreductase [Phycisphaerae bacterium]|nr:SDR family oxidoreductase [Phycisphaerae bacterium]